MDNVPDVNILKSRDDHDLVKFTQKAEGKFHLINGVECSWQKPDEDFDTDKLRQRIEPWLTALFQSEHLSLLLGSGLTKAVCGIAEYKDPTGMGEVKFDVFNEQIDAAAAKTAELVGRKSPNFEDQIRVANELLVGLRHYCILPGDSFDGLRGDTTRLEQSIGKILQDFATSILNDEGGILSSGKSDVGFHYLVNFLMSPASRSGTRDRLQIFTTNYDRLIEAGAEIAGLHLIDRFVGNLSPIFRSSRLNIDMHYNPPGIRGEPRFLEGVARFTKLHGSIDWVEANQEIRRIGLPFGAKDITPYLDGAGFNGVKPWNLMIYPNSSKDRETAAYPYVDLFRDLAASICRPNNTLVTYGYGFGDDHINRVIRDMLTIPSTHLVIISYGDATGRIMETYKKVAKPAQITLLIGSHIGDLQTLVDHYLPKPAIDKTTYKMAELLQARFSTYERGEKKGGKNDDESGDE